jgi:3'-phosphoadenosine 5'-phosphosulfate sulfotransferase (PAPS reductase)/FAD synthetase
MSIYQAQIEQSAEIVRKAVEQYQPYAVIAMFSGGNDSLTALRVAQAAGIKIDALAHIHTGTGVIETTQFVRSFAEREGLRYLEWSAGSKWEDRARERGFPGVGTDAHGIIYRILKATGIRALTSQHIRQGRRNRRILLLNGVRKDESTNRKRQYSGSYYDADPGAPSNIWVNHIWEWTKADCRGYIRETLTKPNPVTELVHRSAECMCGTMQSDEDRRLVSFFFPGWGKWLNRLEREVFTLHGWGWGVPMPEWVKQRKNGQLGMGDDFFMPMCRQCELAQPVENPPTNRRIGRVG